MAEKPLLLVGDLPVVPIALLTASGEWQSESSEHRQSEYFYTHVSVPFALGLKPGCCKYRAGRFGYPKTRDIQKNKLQQDYSSKLMGWKCEGSMKNR
ncbi:MAG: hypothetical protein ACKVOE_04795 [Rickettsiales bacterium]